MDINKRIFDILDKKSLKTKQLADYLDINSSVISTWKKRGTNPPSEYIFLICEFLQVSIEYLLTGNDISNNKNLNLDEETLEILKLYSKLNTKEKTIIKGKLYEYEEIRSNKIKPKITEPTKEKTNNIIELDFNEKTEKIKLKKQDQKAAAGIGTYMPDSVDYTIEEYELNSITRRADHVIVIEGQSMQPTIMDAEEVFIREQNSLESGEIGIFVYGDKVYCKRLHIDYDNRKLILKSDNKDYDDITIKDIENLRTIGKVLM